MPIIVAAIVLILGAVGLALDSISSADRISATLDVIATPLRNTLLVSVGAALLSVAMAVAMALFYSVSGSRTRFAIDATIALQLLIGFVPRNYVWQGILAHGVQSSYSGVRAAAHHLVSGCLPVTLVMTTVGIPLAFLLLRDRFARPSFHEQHAAASLGASWSQALVALVLKPARIHVVFAILSVCGFLAGFYVTPSLMGGGRCDFVGSVVMSFRRSLGSESVSLPLAVLVHTASIGVIAALAGFALVRAERSSRGQR